MDRALRDRLTYLALPAWLAISFLAPLFAMVAHAVMPRVVANYLFFAPQLFFSFSQVVRPTQGGFEPLFTPVGATAFGFVLWGTATLSFSKFANRAFPRAAFWVAPLAIVLIALAMHASFSGLGYSMQLDGP